MATARELITTWGFDFDENALKKMESKFTSLKESAEKIGRKILEVGTALLTVAEITASRGRDIEEFSDLLDMNTDEFQAYQRAAQMAGIEQGKFTMGMNSMYRQAASVLEGNKDAAMSFGRLGVRVVGANGQLKSSGELLMDLASGMSRVDRATRVTFGEKIFGPRNFKMLELLKQGPGALQDYLKKAKGEGMLMSPEEVKRAEEFHTEMEGFLFTLYRLRDMLGLALMPGITKMVAKFQEWFQINKKIIQQALTKFAENMTDIFMVLFKVLVALLPILSFVADHITTIAVAWGLLKGIPLLINAISAAWSAFSFAFVKSPMIGALLLIIEYFKDIHNFATGKRSHFGESLYALKHIFSGAGNAIDEHDKKFKVNLPKWFQTLMGVDAQGNYLHGGGAGGGAAGSAGTTYVASTNVTVEGVVTPESAHSIGGIIGDHVASRVRALQAAHQRTELQKNAPVRQN